MNHIIQINDNFTTYVQSVHHQHAHIILSQVVMPMVSCSLNNILFKVKPSLYQVFLPVIDVMNLCFVHAFLHVTPNFIIYRFILMNLYNTSDAIFFGNIPLQYHIFLVFWLLQDSVVTLIRWGGWSSYHHMYRSSLSLTEKTALKSSYYLTKLQTNISWLLFMAHGVLMQCAYLHFV